MNKRRIKLWSAIMGVVVVVALVLAFLPIGININTDGLLSISLSQVGANPDWLSGYDYRKQITIDGSTAGAQADYQMRLEVYKKAVPFAKNGKYPLGSTNNYPQAYYYNGVTYVVWQGGTNFDPYIDAYNHASGTWHGAVKVGTNPLGASDTHGVPAVIVDNSGYIHVFYGSHSSVQKYSKSTNTEDISAWTAQTDIAGGNTYPNVIKANDGVLWMITRTLLNGGSLRNSTSYRKSTAWATSYEIIEAPVGDAIYHGNIAYDATNGRIHISWSWYDASELKRLNIYHAYLNMSDGHMYSMGGTDLGTTITASEADTYCKIVASGSYQTNHPALHLDANNYPVIICPVQDMTGWYHKFIRWSGSSWDVIQTITESGHQHAYADFIINGASDIDAYLTISAGTNESGDMEKWHWNGSSWAKTSTILAEADVHYDGVNCVNVVVDGVAGLRAVFCEVHVAGYLTTYDLHLYAIDSDDNLLDYTGRVGLAGNCQDDFDDIRLTQSDGLTELYHYRESYVSGDYAIFPIEFNSIPISPNSGTFYLYYDNAGASSGSDPDNTFIAFADWEVDVNDWTEDTTLGTDATLTRSNVAKYTGTYAARLQCALASVGGYYKTCSLDATKQLEFWIRVSGDTQLIVLQDQAAYASAHMFVYLQFLPTATYNNAISIYNGSAWEDTGAVWIADTWYRVKISNFNFTTHTFDIDIYDVNGIWLGGITGAGSYADISSITHINIQDSSAVRAVDTFFDTYRIRKYCNPEPTWGAFGAEEGFNPEITNTPDNIDFGILQVNTTGNTAIDYFTIENTGNCAVDVTIQGTNAIGGDDTWTLSDTATPGENIYGLYAGLDDVDDLFDVIVKRTATYNTLVSDLAEDATQDWGLKIYMPASLSGYDNSEMTAMITLVASES